MILTAMKLRRPLAEILTAHPRDLATMIEWAEVNGE